MYQVNFIYILLNILLSWLLIISGGKKVTWTLAHQRQSYDFLAVILSQDDRKSRERQNILRRHYDSYTNGINVGKKMMTFHYIFVISSESTFYEPESKILWLDGPGDYDHLPQKMLEILTFIPKKFSFKYLIKLDDDSFLCVTRLAHQMQTLNKTNLENYYGGSIRRNQRPLTSGKWQDLNFIKKHKGSYNTFAAGPGYALSSNLVSHIIRKRHTLDLSSRLEDVSIGLWLNDAKPYFHNWAFYPEYCSCDQANKYFLWHYCKQTGELRNCIYHNKPKC